MAVFGREILYDYEVEYMTVVNNVVSMFEAREASKDWAKWEQFNPKGAALLAWAAEQFKRHEDTWQSAYR
jgi:aminopeptidase N